MEDIQFKQLYFLKRFNDTNIALSYTFLDYGKYSITTISDTNGTSSGTIHNKSSSLQITLAKKIKQINLGISAKYIQDKLYTYEATQVAIDLGAQLLLNSQLSIGASCNNISLNKAKYLHEEADMRRINRFGVVYSPLIFKKNINVFLDLISNQKNSIKFSIASSINLHKKLKVYIGKKSDSEIQDISFGVSFSAHLLEIDFSYKPNNIFNDTYRVGVSLGI